MPCFVDVDQSQENWEMGRFGTSSLCPILSILLCYLPPIHPQTLIHYLSGLVCTDEINYTNIQSPTT